MLFDSHTHLNNEDMTEEYLQQLYAEIEKSEVEYVCDVGFDLGSSLKAVEHSKQLTWCYAVVGVHPHDAKTMDEDIYTMIKSLAGKDKVQAIGEIGLDYHYNLSDKESQRYWFRRQIQLANELKMPIVIHSREADQECMDILKEEGAFSDERCSWFPMRKGPDGQMMKDARVLLHCYSGSREMAEQYVKLGATLSVAGPVTYKNNKKTPEVVQAIPIEFLLVETDAPYLTPEPFRGKKNKSPYVEYTARRVAAIKQMPYEEVAEKTCNNAKVFFGIE